MKTKAESKPKTKPKPKPLRYWDMDIDEFIDIARKKYYEETKGMTAQEICNYLHKNSEKVRRALKNTPADAYDWSFLD
jgi:hypothetical protein